MPDDYLKVKIHDFKTNLSKYLRALARGQYKAIVVYRYRRIVGVVTYPYKAQEAEKKRT